MIYASRWRHMNDMVSQITDNRLFILPLLHSYTKIDNYQLVTQQKKQVYDAITMTS